MDKLRTCYRCKEVKPIEAFSRNKNNPLGRGYQCRVCSCQTTKEWRKKNPEKHVEQVKRWQAKNPEKKKQIARDAARRYRASNPHSSVQMNHGITPEQYLAMVDAQNGCCAICGRNKFGRGKASKLWVDHCHTELRIRGLLCQRCNLGIGYFEDNPKLPQSAINYLIRMSR